MTTRINTLQEALTAIAETAYKINGSTVLTSEHCAALTGAFYHSQQREDALTKARDEAMRDLAESQARIAELENTLAHYSSMLNAERVRGDALSAERNDLHARIEKLEAWYKSANDAAVSHAWRIGELTNDLAAARKALCWHSDRIKQVIAEESYPAPEFVINDLAAARSAQSSAIDPGINISGTVFSYGEIERDGETIYGIILNTGREALLSQNDNTLGRDAVLFVAAKAAQSDGGKEGAK